MRKSFVFALLCLMTIYGLDYVPFEGLRLDMSAITLNRDIIASIIPALNRTEHSAFSTYKESGSFGSQLSVSKLKITKYVVNEKRLDLTQYEYTYPIYKIKGTFEAIYFHITFHYQVTWIGIPIDTGTGQAEVTNVNNEILVLWNETDPDVKLPHPWDIKNMTLTSFIKPTSWITSLLHKEFIKDFNDAVDHAMDGFAHNLLRTYRRIEDVLPDDVDLVFYNDILSVQPTVGGTYFSIAFKTNITVNGNIHKKFYRRMNSSVVPQGDFDFCFAGELVPDVMDVLGKGGYYDKEVDPLTWDFKTREVQELFYFMPSLRERFKGTEEFSIFCMSSRYETINDLTQRELPDPLPELQNPVYCLLHIKSTGEYLFVVDIYARFFYELKPTSEGFFGHVRSVSLKDIQVVPPLPISKKEKLGEHVKAYLLYTFFDKELLSPGITVKPNRLNELVFDFAYFQDEAVCLYYNENRTASDST